MLDEEKASEIVDKVRKLPVVSSILVRLEKDLPQDLCYHTLSHTLDVVYEALLFAVVEGRSGRDLELLAIAAAYHDAGFLQARTENEEIAARLAKEALEASGSYSAEEIEIVQKLIIDTKLIATPDGVYRNCSNILSRYLLDADLSNLGRDDFFEKLSLHCQELGRKIEEEGPRALRLMMTHKWRTDAATALREKKKRENMKELVARYSEID